MKIIVLYICLFFSCWIIIWIFYLQQTLIKFKSNKGQWFSFLGGQWSIASEHSLDFSYSVTQMVVPHWLIGQLPYSFTAKIWLFFPNPVFIYSNLPIPQVIFNFLNCSPENSCMHYNLVGWNDKLGTILSVVCLLVKCYVIIHYAKVRNAWELSVLLVNVSKYYILFVYGVWTLMGIWVS